MVIQKLEYIVTLKAVTNVQNKYNRIINDISTLSNKSYIPKHAKDKLDELSSEYSSILNECKKAIEYMKDGNIIKLNDYSLQFFEDVDEQMTVVLGQQILGQQVATIIE